MVVEVVSHDADSPSSLYKVGIDVVRLFIIALMASILSSCSNLRLFGLFSCSSWTTQWPFYVGETVSLSQPWVPLSKVLLSLTMSFYILNYTFQSEFTKTKSQDISTFPCLPPSLWLALLPSRHTSSWVFLFSLAFLHTSTSSVPFQFSPLQVDRYQGNLWSESRQDPE